MIQSKLCRPSVWSAFTSFRRFPNPSCHRLVSSVSLSSSSSIEPMESVVTNRADPFGENKVTSHRLSRLDLEFLGSGSFSTRFRFASSIFLHLDKGDTWLIDAPDGAVRQSNLVTHRNFCHIRKIFITSWMHDTYMGLPNLVASRLMSSPEQLPDKLSLQVYGPPGIISYLQQTLPFALRGQYAQQLAYLTVIELNFSQSHLDKLAHESSVCFPWAKEMADTMANKKHYMSTHIEEQNALSETLFKCQRIYADEETGFWTLMDDKRCTMTAGLVGSNIPTFGFVFQEPSQYANIPSEQVSFLRSQYDFPVDALSQIKLGRSVSMRKRVIPNSNYSHNSNSSNNTEKDVQIGEEVVMSAQDLGLKRFMGRKLCIVNAGSDASPLAAAAKNCDVLVHPVSMSNSREEEAYLRGMSTAQLTVTAACQVLQAKRLLLTRLSSHHSDEIDETLAAWTTRFDRVSKHVFFAKDGALVSVPPMGFNKDDITEGIEIGYPVLNEAIQYSTNVFNIHADANGNNTHMGVNVLKMVANDHVDRRYNKHRANALNNSKTYTRPDSHVRKKPVVEVKTPKQPIAKKTNSNQGNNGNAQTEVLTATSTSKASEDRR